ncbi:hypothetical protein ES703_07249 [subsurface metagenome]
MGTEKRQQASGLLGVPSDGVLAGAACLTLHQEPACPVGGGVARCQANSAQLVSAAGRENSEGQSFRFRTRGAFGPHDFQSCALDRTMRPLRKCNRLHYMVAGDNSRYRSSCAESRALVQRTGKPAPKPFGIRWVPLYPASAQVPSLPKDAPKTSSPGVFRCSQCGPVDTATSRCYTVPG